MDQVDRAVPIMFISDSSRSLPTSFEAGAVPASSLTQDDEAGIDEVILFLTTESLTA